MLADTRKSKKAFVHVWHTLHHERLKYPSTTTGKMAVAPEPTNEEKGD
jgi:membrane-associated HD superfamily phosphohydrolase